MTKILTWEDLTIAEQEHHLTKDCGFNILEEPDMSYDEQNFDPELFARLPYAHPTWNAGTAELWEPETTNLDATYDRVLVCKRPTEQAAARALLRMCMQQNCRRVSEMFFSAGYWCVRVRDVE